MQRIARYALILALTLGLSLSAGPLPAADTAPTAPKAAAAPAKAPAKAAAEGERVALVNGVAIGQAEFQTEYGNVSAASIGAITAIRLFSPLIDQGKQTGQVAFGSGAGDVVHHTALRNCLRPACVGQLGGHRLGGEQGQCVMEGVIQRIYGVLQGIVPGDQSVCIPTPDERRLASAGDPPITK